MIVAVIQERLLKQVLSLFRRNTPFGTSQDSQPVPVGVRQPFGSEHHVGNPGVDLRSRLHTGKSAWGHTNDLQTACEILSSRRRRRFDQIERLAKNIDMA